MTRTVWDRPSPARPTASWWHTARSMDWPAVVVLLVCAATVGYLAGHVGQVVAR